MTDLAKLVVRLEAEIGKYQENLDKAEKRLAGFERASKNLLGNIAGGFAAFFTIDRLRAWGDRILTNADAVGKLAERTGIAVEPFSRLAYAFETNNVEGEALSTMLRTLNKNLSEAAGNAESEAARAFRAMGVEVTDATGRIRSADEVILDMADRFASYEDGANKSALATQLLGRAGEQAIPALNGGAEGLRRLGDEAERVGRVIDEDLARQADEFNDRLDRLRSTLIDGIGNRVASELLPSLNALGEEFENTADKSLILERSTEAIATIIRGVTDLALGTATAFVKLGNAIGGSAAAAVAAAQLDFDRASQIIEETTADNLAIEADYQKQRAALWKKGGEDVLEEIEITVKRIRDEAPNLAGGKALEDAIKKATDKLKEMQTSLRTQVDTFGLGEAAIVRYRLELGDLSDEVKAAGSQGREFAESIIAQAEAIQKLKDSKEVAEALADVNAQILELTGNTAEATILEFDRKNAELVTKLRQQGNEEGLKQLEVLTKLTVAQADFNELTQRAQQIQADLARTEERLNNSRNAGALTELGYQQELSSARKQAAEDLAAIHTEQEKIAAQAGNPALVENVKNLGLEIESLRNEADVLGQSLRAGFEDSFGDSLKSFIKGTESAGDAFRSFVEDVGDQLLDLATQFATQQLFQALMGTGTTGAGGGGGGWLSALAGVFAGGKAAGGTVTEGLAYRVNENTPNSEWFVPSRSGTIVPAEGIGQKIEQTNNFYVQAPGGRISLETQQQAATRMQTALVTAQRRNS